MRWMALVGMALVVIGIIALVIQVLMEASKSAQTIAICGLTPHFTKVFTMVGITKYAALYPDETAALAAL